MDDGQVSMDFLMAITIFALGLVLLISQVPMLFAPLQTVSTDIQPVAYRTSMILVEDGGVYENETTGYIRSDWEDPEEYGWNYNQNCINITNYTDNVKRIGLAMSTRELGWPSSSEDIVPNNLSVNKITAFQDWWNDTANQSKIVGKLGLRVTYNNNPITYSYNISLRDFDDTLVNSSDPLLQIGDSIPTSGSITVEKIERIVAIGNTTDVTNTTSIAGHECAKLVVCIWR
ncbi:MAG TPA: hypothetical protein VMW40_00680 [Candidatus Bathyarchaeia archaeon]|nr:hypothetical protein [Candidatus Bathyarchaeia archaeon]